MKIAFLAAAALIAAPALAQSSGSTGTSSPTSNGGQGTAARSGVQNNTQGSGNTQPMPMTQSEQQGSMPMSSSQSSMPSSSGTMPMASSGGDPVGGYQPSSPAMQGQMQPGATVQFVPAQTPDQAYPAPAPMAKYPICKKGQYDKCIQRGGR